MNALKQILLLGLMMTFLSEAGGAEITSSVVYAQAMQIEQETELIRRHFKITAKPAAYIPVQANLQPRHVWQKAYMVQVKINLFRRKQGLITIAPVGIEPFAKLDPYYTWAQTQRILTEIRIARKLLGIPGNIGAVPQVAGKRPIDVFNKLHEISLEWDVLSGAGGEPSHTYAEAMRINEDIDTLLRRLHIPDTAVPPAKTPEAVLGNVLEGAFALMEEVHRLQRMLGLETVDFGAFRKSDNVTPADVFNMTCMILSELQLVKAKLGLNHAITPPAAFQESKSRAEVAQVLGYAANKLKLIQKL